MEDTEAAGVLVDSNVLLDLATKDPVWAGWSNEILSKTAARYPLIINPIIYAEVSVGYARIEDLDEALPASVYRREPLPWEAGFLAGKCFLIYKRRGGVRHSPLPDFYIGGHAASGGLALLTRDPKPYRTYFPTVRLIAPQNL